MCILFGCTITLKTKINVFLKNFRVEGPQKVIWSEEKISKNVDFSLSGNTNGATTQTHIWNRNFFHVLAHCALRSDAVSSEKKGK